MTQLEHPRSVACPDSASRTGLRVLRLERWIDAHLGEDITLDRLCSVAGVGPRTLQKAMLAVRGLTLLEAVQQRRFTAARNRLLARSPGIQVSRVALDCGFRHLGRFAVRYRERFGESPRETARNHAGRHAGCRQAPVTEEDVA